MTEVWKPVRGYEGLYEVSNLGKVKALRKMSGTCYRKEKELSLNRLSVDGYVRISLSNGVDKPYETKMHRIVAEHFVPNPLEKETVNHIDGDKLNNRADNLEWADRREQLAHAYKLGLRSPARGCSQVGSKLSKEDVDYIRKNYIRQSTEYGTVALARKFGVTNVVIGNVLRGKTYKYD